MPKMEHETLWEVVHALSVLLGKDFRAGADTFGQVAEASCIPNTRQWCGNRMPMLLLMIFTVVDSRYVARPSCSTSSEPLLPALQMCQMTGSPHAPVAPALNEGPNSTNQQD